METIKEHKHCESCGRVITTDIDICEDCIDKITEVKKNECII